MDMIFKTTMFGGFDKQDVMSYIERTVQEYESRLGALEKEREALQGDLSAALDRVEAAEEARRQLEEQGQALAERLRGVEREYQSLRSHMVDVELDARQRAGAIEQEAKHRSETLLTEAEERCQAMLAQAKKELADMSRCCGALRADVATAVSHVAVGQLPLAFDKLLEELKALETDQPAP